MKESPQSHYTCSECGDFPKILVADVIRSVNFSTKHKSVTKNNQQEYGTLNQYLDNLRVGDVSKILKIDHDELEILDTFPPVMKHSADENLSKTNRKRVFKDKSDIENFAEIIPLRELFLIAGRDCKKTGSTLETTWN